MRDELYIVPIYESPSDDVEAIKQDEYNILGNIWRRDRYPDDYTLCKIGFDLAKKCQELHLNGLIVANEWNENNVLIEPKKDLFL